MSAPGPPEEPYRTPPNQMATWTVLGAAFVLTLALFAIRCPHDPESSRPYASRSLPPDVEPVLLAAPEMEDEYWPCSDCHEGEPTDRTVRELEDDHDEMDFEHGDTWCLHCHDVEDRDRLHLADGTLVSLDESWKLCTQCHAHKRAEWRAGVHGKRSGHWWGPKEYRTCVACHNPHSPPFKPLELLPPPRRPEQIVLNSHLAENRHEAP